MSAASKMRDEPKKEKVWDLGESNQMLQNDGSGHKTKRNLMGKLKHYLRKTIKQ